MSGFDARLVTRITTETRRRLKLAAAVADTSISALLTEVLDRGLPTDAELGDQVRGAASPAPEADS
jgi:hypothetical protein